MAKYIKSNRRYAIDVEGLKAMIIEHWDKRVYNTFIEWCKNNTEYARVLMEILIYLPSVNERDFAVFYTNLKSLSERKDAE